jgi:hypothetical protein
MREYIRKDRRSDWLILNVFEWWKADRQLSGGYCLLPTFVHAD